MAYMKGLSEFHWRRREQRDERLRLCKVDMLYQVKFEKSPERARSA
jgi:hypothetical protein